jgi:hypothetical protein
MRIEAILRGGLGNQLFQYAFFRNLQLITSAELFIERRIGFSTDFRYRRKLEIEELINDYDAPKASRAMSLLSVEKVSTLISPKFGHRLASLLNSIYIYENSNKFSFPSLKRSAENLIVHGYWQSPLYFQDHQRIIVNEIVSWLETYDCPEVREIANSSLDCVAVGIRTYSESVKPSAHARDGRQKDLTEWQRAIDHLVSQGKSIKFLIFSTDRETISKQIDFRGQSVEYVAHTRDRSPKVRLLQFASCRHHIFNNSSFYWWGAFLRPYIRVNLSHLVYASDNFLNEDGLPSKWNKF